MRAREADITSSAAKRMARPAGLAVTERAYLDALEYARRQLASPKGLPLSMRLLHEAHRRLMRGVRGHRKQLGEVRGSQNWIGGTRPRNAVFVPPPPKEVPTLHGDLEKYLHANDALPPLVRIGLAHVQFETIHMLARLPVALTQVAAGAARSGSGSAH